MIEELRKQNSHIKKRLIKNYNFFIHNQGKVKQLTEKQMGLEDRQKDEKYDKARILLGLNKDKGSRSFDASKSGRTDRTQQSSLDEGQSQEEASSEESERIDINL